MILPPVPEYVWTSRAEFVECELIVMYIWVHQVANRQILVVKDSTTSIFSSRVFDVSSTINSSHQRQHCCYPLSDSLSTLIAMSSRNWITKSSWEYFRQIINFTNQVHITFNIFEPCSHPPGHCKPCPGMISHALKEGPHVRRVSLFRHELNQGLSLPR